MKWRQTKIVENKGILYVQNQVNEQGSIFRTIHQETDIGIDGLIEFVLNNEVTGILVGVQVKSGDSYLNSNKDGFELYIDEHHINYWLNYNLPVYLIFYSPLLNKASYVSIENFVKQAEYHDKLPVRKIEASLHKTFDSESISKDFPLLVNTFRDEQLLFKCVQDCICGLPKQQVDSFQILVHHPKSYNTKITLYIASKLLMHEDEETAKDALYVLGYGVGRHRWSWNPNNKEEKALIEYANKLVKDLTESEIERIIELVKGEHLHGPDGLGERAFDIIFSYGVSAWTILKRIMCDPDKPIENRSNCMYFYFYGNLEEILLSKVDLLENVYTRNVYIHLMKSFDDSYLEETPPGPTLFE